MKLETRNLQPVTGTRQPATTYRPTMFSKARMDYLFFHILDGFKVTGNGLKKLQADGLISKEEYLQLVEKNTQRVLDRIEEFKASLAEAGKRMISIFFAVMFAYMQINGDDLDMRRPSRTRTTRSVRDRNGRRRGEDIGGSF